MFARWRRSAQTLVAGGLFAALLPGACTLPDYNFGPGNGGSSRPPCMSDTECREYAQTPVCNPQTSTCVQCLTGGTTNHCSEGQYCRGNRCTVGCAENSDCADGLTCDVGSNRCHGCTSDEQCSLGTICQAEYCVASCETNEDCPTNFTCCDNGCADTRNDPSHCGGCGNTCSQGAGKQARECIGGACLEVEGCPEGFGECDGNPDTACETELNDADSNCGACRTKCDLRNANASCNTGVCKVGTCKAGWGDCISDVSGCETQLGTRMNCAACGDTCRFDEDAHVTSNLCEGPENNRHCDPKCLQNYDNCDGNLGNGCEADLRSPQHCGGCGNECDLPNVAEHRCDKGTCGIEQCAALRDNCDGDASNGCELDVSESLTNCGKCGVKCGDKNGTPSCVEGQCQIACVAGLGDCNEINADGCEHNVTNDPANCGECGNVCGAGTPFCVQGSCRSHLDIRAVNTDQLQIARGYRLSFMHTLTSAASPRRLILVGVALRANEGGAREVRYGNLLMTELQAVRTSNQSWAGIYGLVAPNLAPGDYEVFTEATRTDAFGIAANVVELENVEAPRSAITDLVDAVAGKDGGACSGSSPRDEIVVETAGAFIFSVASLYTTSGSSPTVMPNAPLVVNAVSRVESQLMMAAGRIPNAPAGSTSVGYRVQPACNRVAHVAVAIKPAVTP